jgi:hypothetical protein
MKKNFTSVIICAAGMVLAGVMVGLSGVPSQEATSFKMQTNTVPGIGFVYGYVKYTNSAGSTSITPSNNVTSFTFSDVSGFPPPYVSYAIGVDITMATQYPTNNYANTVTFPVSTNHHYTLTAYVISNPPSNGTPIITSLVQNTN